MTRRLLLCLIALLLPALALADAGVHASLDRDSVHLGETVTLNLSMDRGSIDTPDLSPLSQDFQVLGTSSSSSISVVNGQRSVQFTIGIALRPRHTGQLTVPSLSLGGEHTQPLKLEVLPPDANAAANAGKDVFVEASAEPDHGYVGQQMVLVVRLYYDTNLNSGTLDDPQVAGMDVRRLGKDIDYDAQRGNRGYHVLERRYALIPQHAGTFKVPSLYFQGVASDPSDPMDMNRFFGQGSWFGGGSTVSAASNALTLHVAAQPADWGSSAWLPARQLTLSLDGLPANGQARVGQPLNLRMSVQASGLPAEALPLPSLPALQGAEVYPDRPVDNTGNDGKWLLGKRERAFAVVPQRPGPLTIPATTLSWFDVGSGHAQTARIPARTLTVLPALGSAAAPAVPASAPAAAASTGTAMPAPMAAAPAPTASARRPLPWRWIAMASLGLWLLAMLALFWRRRRPSSAAPAASPTPAANKPQRSARDGREAFMQAARGTDAAAQAHALLDWARSERPQLPNLGALAAALSSEAQRAAIADLQRRHYAGAAGERAVDLAAAFARGFAWRSEGSGDDDSPLPPLYPFDVRRR